MKINQFAHLAADAETKARELNQIGFLNCDAQHNDDLNHIWIQFILACLPHLKTPAAKKAYLSDLLATSTLDVVEFKQSQTVDLKTFYLVALQLLDFEADVDFDINDPLASMDKLGLYHAQQLDDRTNLINALYDLLCTHTKHGQTLLDRLAALGYFTKFYDLPAIKKPLFFNGKAQPIFDTNKLIREVVYIESDLDTDHDGKLDLLKVEIIRPKDTEYGLKVPVLYTASPYNQGTNDVLGEKMLHPATEKLTHKTPTTTSYADIKFEAKTPNLPAKREVAGRSTRAEETFDRELSYTLNDYFLARGFGVVYAAGIGTRDSEGFRTCGSQAETSSTTAVIEWLTGNRRAFTNRSENIEIKAWWCNKKVAMTGKSYLGTLATAAATTGIEGLETIISEAAISSWYDYYRDGGLVVSPDGYVGEDADVLAQECFSRRKDLAQYQKIAAKWQTQLDSITAGQDRQTGNYNRFWDERNYLNNVANIKCDVVLVHGLNDWNVKPRNVFNLYQALQELPIKTKLILHQGKHIYINNFQSLDFTDMTNLWLSHKLYGIDNQATTVLPDVLIQDNVKPDTWKTYPTWQATTTSKLWLTQAGQLADTPDTGSLSFNDQLTPKAFADYQADLDLWKNDLVSSEASPLEQARLKFQTAPLEQPLLISGAPKLSVKVACSADYGLLSFMLVDLGKAKRLNNIPTVLEPKGILAGYNWRENDLVEFTLGKDTPFKLISKGHINLQNRTELWRNDELLADKFYQLEVTLQPTHYQLPAGRRLGLIVYATDMFGTLRGNEDISYTLDLADCNLELPYFNN